MMWTGTVSVILQLSVSNSQKIATVSWTSRISLNTSKKLGLAVGDRNTDKMASVPVGDTEGPVTGVIIEDPIRGVTGAGRNMGNTGDLAGESDAHGSGLNKMGHVVTLCVLDQLQPALAENNARRLGKEHLSGIKRTVL